MAGKDGRTLTELFAAAVDWSKSDGEEDWAAVATLHHLGTREVLDHAVKLTKAPDPRVRARAADILGQLGIPERSFPQECLDAVLLLATDASPVVLQAAAVALGHLRDGKGTAALVKLVDYPDGSVRHAAAFALGGRDDADAVQALIHLTRDPDPDVRDWATFGLGSIGNADTPEVREALHERLNDCDHVRYEALCGLAERGDPRAVPVLIHEIETRPEDLDLRRPALAMLGRSHMEGNPTADQIISWLRQLR